MSMNFPIQVAQQVLQIPKDDAIRVIEAAGYTWRVVSEDGAAYVVTMDHRLDRINLTLVNDIVTETSVG